MTPLAVVAGLVVFWLLLSVKVLNEYERGVIAAEKNSTVIFPVPIDWMKALMGARRE